MSMVPKGKPKTEAAPRATFIEASQPKEQEVPTAEQPMKTVYCTHPFKKTCPFCRERFCVDCDPYHIDACREANRP